MLHTTNINKVDLLICVSPNQKSSNLIPHNLPCFPMVLIYSVFLFISRIGQLFSFVFIFFQVCEKEEILKLSQLLLH